MKNSPLAEASEVVLETTNQASENIKDVAHRATDVAKNACQTVKVKADDSLACSKEFVRQNPLAVVVGALAFGAAIGYLVATRQQEEHSLRERLVEDPLSTARDAVFAVLAPMSRRLHDQYDSARGGAGRALEKLQRNYPSHASDSWANQIGRVGTNLKFW